MANWTNRRDTRDPVLILMDREPQPCECQHLERLFGEEYCPIRKKIKPYNFHCQFRKPRGK